MGLKKWLKKIPAIEAGRAFLEQWGLWKFVAIAASGVGAAAMTIWAYLETLQPWQAVLVFIAAAGIIFGALDFALSAWGKWLAIKASPKLDRVALADRTRKLAQGVAELAGQVAGRHAIAWQEETRGMRPSINHGDKTTQLRAWAIERYAEKFHADTWEVISAASRLISIDESDLWKVRHVLSSEHEIGEMAAFLARLVVSLENPALPELPLSDRRREERKAAKLQVEDSAPQLPQGTGSETQP